MNKVTLYQVSKTTQVVSGDHLELRQYSYDQIAQMGFWKRIVFIFKGCDL